LAKIGIDVVYDRKFNLKNISRPNRDKSVPIWSGDVLLGGDPSPYMHADFIIQNFFIKESLYKLNGDSTINGLYEKAATSMDVANQRKLYEDIDSYIHDNALAIFSHQVIRIHAVKRGISYTPAINGLLSLRNVSMKGEAR
jgi:ABC-type transport system substrate-binding protein